VRELRADLRADWERAVTRHEALLAGFAALWAIGHVGFHVGLPVLAAHAALEVVHEANARLALERAAFDVGLGHGKTAEVLVVFVLRDARVAHPSTLATQR